PPLHRASVAKRGPNARCARLRWASASSSFSFSRRRRVWSFTCGTSQSRKSFPSVDPLALAQSPRGPPRQSRSRRSRINPSRRVAASNIGDTRAPLSAWNCAWALRGVACAENVLHVRRRDTASHVVSDGRRSCVGHAPFAKLVHLVDPGGSAPLSFAWVDWL